MRVKAFMKKEWFFVKVRFGWKEKPNSREIDFLSKGSVPGLMKVIQKRRKCLEFSGKSGISLQELVKSPISQKDFLLVIAQFCEVYQRVRKSNLLPKNILMDFRYILFNTTTKELAFAYIPMESNCMGADFLSAMTELTGMVRPISGQSGDVFSSFAFFLRDLEAFDTAKIESFIRTLDRSVMEMLNHGAAPKNLHDKPVVMQEEMVDVEMDTGYLGEIDWNYEDDTGLLNRTGEMDVSDSDTGLLNDLPSTQEHSVTVKGVLRRLLNGETIPVDKPVFRIGKERSYVDYFIGDNAAVSRSHADIVCRNGRIFIKDLNSKNRTFVNGEAIMPETEVELFDGDKVKLANEEFVFSKN